MLSNICKPCCIAMIAGLSRLKMMGRAHELAGRLKLDWIMDRIGAYYSDFGKNATYFEDFEASTYLDCR